MCGRFTANVKKKGLEEEWNLAVPPEFKPRYNIAPSQLVGAIINQRPAELSMLRWGLIPSWANDSSAASKMINARVETLHEKPSFQKLVQQSRCLIPATSWFEWMHGKNGQPFRIGSANIPLFAFAGLWDVWKKPDGSELSTFTIITTAAAPAISHIHERMPLVLPKNIQQDWLQNNISPFEAAQIAEQLEFEFVPVSSMVNNTKNDSEELLKEFRETLF